MGRTRGPAVRTSAGSCQPCSRNGQHPPPPLQERRPRFAFSRAAPEGVSVSADGLAVTSVGTHEWQGASALVELP